MLLNYKKHNFVARLSFLNSFYSFKAVLALIDQAIVSGTNFITTVFLGRLFSKEEFGAFIIAFTTGNIINTLQASLIISPTQVLGAPRRGRDQQLYLSGSLVFQILFSLGTVLFLLSAIQILTARNINRYTISAILGLALGTVPIQVREFLRRVLFMRVLTNGVLLNDGITSLVQLLGVYLLWLQGSLTAASAWGIIGFSSLVGCLAGAIQTKRFFSKDIRYFFSALKENWVFAKWSVPGTMARLGATQVFLLFVFSVLGSSTAGILGASEKVLGPTQIILFGMANLITPIASHKFMAEGVESLNLFLKKAASFTIGTIGLYCLLVCLWPESFLYLFYRSSYLGYGNIVRCYSIYYLVTAIVMILNVGIGAIRRPDLAFYSSVLGIFLMLVTSLPLIKVLGIYGALVGLILTAVTWMVMQFRHYNKYILKYSFGHSRFANWENKGRGE